MDQKRKLSVFSKLIFLLMSFTLVLLMGIKADARPKEWTELEGQWYCADGNVYYIIGNTFYVSPMEPHSMGERHKIAGWKTVDGEYLKIVHGYGNKVFINKIDELDGSSILYAVDIKTKNKAKISGKCSITAASGRYMYGNAEKASDTGAYPVFIWKISGNSVKKGKTLGKFIFGTTAIKNKIYYASYPDSRQKKMTVYRCSPDGSNRRKLFILEGKGDFCQVLISDINEETVTAYLSGDEPGEYIYTIKTGKLKKK